MAEETRSPQPERDPELLAKLVTAKESSRKVTAVIGGDEWNFYSPTVNQVCAVSKVFGGLSNMVDLDDPEKALEALWILGARTEGWEIFKTPADLGDYMSITDMSRLGPVFELLFTSTDEEGAVDGDDSFRSNGESGESPAALAEGTGA